MAMGLRTGTSVFHNILGFKPNETAIDTRQNTVGEQDVSEKRRMYQVLPTKAQSNAYRLGKSVMLYSLWAQVWHVCFAVVGLCGMTVAMQAHRSRAQRAVPTGSKSI